MLEVITKNAMLLTMQQRIIQQVDMNLSDEVSSANKLSRKGKGSRLLFFNIKHGRPQSLKGESYTLT